MPYKNTIKVFISKAKYTTLIKIILLLNNEPAPHHSAFENLTICVPIPSVRISIPPIRVMGFAKPVTPIVSGTSFVGPAELTLIKSLAFKVFPSGSHRQLCSDIHRTGHAATAERTCI